MYYEKQLQDRWPLSTKILNFWNMFNKYKKVDVKTTWKANNMKQNISLKFVTTCLNHVFSTLSSNFPVFGSLFFPVQSLG